MLSTWLKPFITWLKANCTNESTLYNCFRAIAFVFECHYELFRYQNELYSLTETCRHYSEVSNNFGNNMLNSTKIIKEYANSWTRVGCEVRHVLPWCYVYDIGHANVLISNWHFIFHLCSSNTKFSFVRYLFRSVSNVTKEQVDLMYLSILFVHGEQDCLKIGVMESICFSNIVSGTLRLEQSWFNGNVYCLCVFNLF